jgi:protein-disulfide isomerase
MRKAALGAILMLLGSASGRADEATRQRVGRFFSGWYSVCPGNKVTVTEDREVAIPGYEAYKADRACELKNRDESGVTLVDTAHTEIFVGQVLHDDSRKDRPFSAAADLPVLKGVLQQEYGLPIGIGTKGAARGALVPIEVRIQQAPGALATLRGFVSQDGASLLLGEFFPLDVAPEVTRAKLLAEGAPAPSGKKTLFTVAAFIDFQCEKCRVRTPQIRDYAFTHGGALRIRYLPLVKIHDWSFAAAECAAALSAVSPALEDNYERSVFAKAASMNPPAARETASDVAEAAGVETAFEAELSSGRARDRVIADIDLALRLGLNGTPAFFFRGVWLTSEPELAEHFIDARLSEPGGSTGKSSPR